MTTVIREDGRLSQKVFNDIKETRKTTYINNFWKDLSHNDDELYKTWNELKDVMSDGKIPYLYKEMIYVAVSVANNCNYCIHSHTYAARKAGMTNAQYNELLRVILMASKTNALATALGTEVDGVFDTSVNEETKT